MAGETVLVSGGSGFIGGWCVVTLLNQGYTVRTTIRSLAKEAAVRARLATQAPVDKLSFYAAELTSDAGWDEAAAGCDYVLHVASPLGVDNPKDPNELIVPARDGALRALRAAVKAGVKRVVMTSSVAAAYRPHSKGSWVSDETVWTDPTEAGVGAYPQSKTIAEKAAWDFIGQHGGATTLAVVNPALVLGPILTKDNLGSVQVVQRLLNGSMPGAPRLGFNIVDVRDVADLHIRAMLVPEAAGQRFIAAGPYMWMTDLAHLLRDKLGARAAKAPTRILPDFVLRLIALFDPALKSVSANLGQKHEFSSAKAQSVLGWRPRPVESTVVECAESLIEKGAV
jgi:nucleoside-diphosphate-sugar epimerase